MKFNSLIPELSVSNIEKSKDFYLKLGFKIIYERIEDKFCFLQLEENNNNWNVGKLEYPYGRGINISMTIKNIDKMYEEILAKKIKLYLELETHKYQVADKTYYDKEFLLQDPDGYLLRFNN